ncbi:MAG: rhomboid family intramembrane serine protease [Polyangiaceae bacterium]|nr:rhomboid family intramembrane serine protease [Polyangiaceae bacterium]
MVGLACLWIAFAAALNWANAEGAAAAFGWLAGSDDALASGQVWRFFTALLLHQPSSPWHLLSVLMVLYFFATPLETRWGPRRVYLVLVGSGVFAYVVQLLVGWIIAPLAQPIWYGSLAAAEGLIVAWALSARSGERIRLFFVWPVSARGLIIFGIVMAVANLLARRAMAEGFVAPFAGMLAGYLFSDRSALRRLWLKLRLRRIQSEVASLSRARAARTKAAPHLRVIRGGAAPEDDDDDGPGRDKRHLH